MFVQLKYSLAILLQQEENLRKMNEKYRKLIPRFEQESLFSSFDQGAYQKDNNSSFSSFDSVNVSQLPSFCSRTKRPQIPINRKHNQSNQNSNLKGKAKDFLSSQGIANILHNRRHSQSFGLPKNNNSNFEGEYNKYGNQFLACSDENKEINRINLQADRKIQKNIDLPLKLSQQNEFKSKYDDLVKIKDQAMVQNHQLRKQNESLKDRLKRYEDSDKKIDSLNKENNFLKIEIEKMKNKQSFAKINVDISDRNDMLSEVQRLHQKCKAIQSEMRQQMRLRQQQIKSKYEHQIKRIKGIGSWRDKFVTVFLDMLEKIPIEIDPEWSKKKKVRIGWQSVKLMIKKSIKFGIPPPNIQVVK